MITAIYVEQYDGWWRLSIDEWKAICKEGAKGGGHTLPKTMLKHRPRFIKLDGTLGEHGRSYWTPRKDILLYHPLDWEKEEYQSALQELKEKGV